MGQVFSISHYTEQWRSGQGRRIKRMHVLGTVKKTVTFKTFFKSLVSDGFQFQECYYMLLYVQEVVTHSKQ